MRQNGTFFGVLAQGLAYALLFVYFWFTAEDGWDTTMVVFDDVMPGNTALAADTRRRAAAVSSSGGPIPPPKDAAVLAAYYEADYATANQHPSTLVSQGAGGDARSNYYEDPRI
jgi:hypothetical protein